MLRADSCGLMETRCANDISDVGCRVLIGDRREDSIPLREKACEAASYAVRVRCSVLVTGRVRSLGVLLLRRDVRI